MLLCNSCKKLLEEHPQASIVPSFFNTPAGVLGGISGVYNDIRSAQIEGFSAQMVAEHLVGPVPVVLWLYTHNGWNAWMWKDGGTLPIPISTH